MARGYNRDDTKQPGHSCGEVEVVRTTDAAVLVRMPDHDETWFPFSQIHADSEINDGNCEVEAEGTLVVTQWIAKEKGLDEEE